MPAMNARGSRSFPVAAARSTTPTLQRSTKIASAMDARVSGRTIRGEPRRRATVPVRRRYGAEGYHPTLSQSGQGREPRLAEASHPLHSSYLYRTAETNQRQSVLSKVPEEAPGAMDMAVPRLQSAAGRRRGSTTSPKRACAVGWPSLNDRGSRLSHQCGLGPREHELAVLRVDTDRRRRRRSRPRATASPAGSRSSAGSHASAGARRTRDPSRPQRASFAASVSSIVMPRSSRRERGLLCDEIDNILDRVQRYVEIHHFKGIAAEGEESRGTQDEESAT